MRRAEKEKGIEAQRMKHPTSTRAIVALIGDEEQKRTKKETGSEAELQPSYPGPFGRLLRGVKGAKSV